MVGPVLYEGSVPFFRKALQNQIQLLKKGEAWCREIDHEISMLSKATLANDMSALPFHVKFCTYNAVQLLVDLGIVETESPCIDDDETPIDELIALLEQTLKVFDQALPEKFAGKETETIDVNLGAFSVPRTAIDYVHEISLPSFWFHHTMVYSILRSQGVPLTKQLFLSAW